MCTSIESLLKVRMLYISVFIEGVINVREAKGKCVHTYTLRSPIISYLLYHNVHGANKIICQKGRLRKTYS
jgi:hypothetical protein